MRGLLITSAGESEPRGVETTSATVLNPVSMASQPLIGMARGPVMSSVDGGDESCNNEQREQSRWNEPHHSMINTAKSIVTERLNVKCFLTNAAIAFKFLQILSGKQMKPKLVSLKNYTARFIP